MLILIGNYRGSRKTQATITLPCDSAVETINLHTGETRTVSTKLTVDVQPDTVVLYAIRGK
jgi:hypothetical protein